jgi:murein L,D-transpeptidase YcbB/YkuD
LRFFPANFPWDSDSAGTIAGEGLIFLFTRLQGDALSLQPRGFGRNSMQGVRDDHLRAGAAMALALALVSYPNNAIAMSEAEISAAVPLPAAADVPPPTVNDTSAAPPVSATAAPAPAARNAADAATAPTGAKAAALSPADAAVAEILREQLAAGKFDRILAGRKERSSIEAFYASRDFAPLWIGDGALNARAKAASAYLAGVDADALDPGDYPIPHIAAGAEPAALAEAEIRFTDSVLTFARHAQTGRVHYSRIASDIAYNLVRPEPSEVLAQLAAAKNVGEQLASFNPQQPGYKALKAKLAELRNSRVEGKPAIAHGLVLRYGKDKKGKEIVIRDPRVPLLRERLGVAGDASDTSYDKSLADAVAKFQRQHGLRANGQLNAETVDAINGPQHRRNIDIVIANMERWRWLPRDLGKVHVMVNIPDYTLQVVRDNKVIWKTKIVVGKPTLPTPITSAEMKYITVNPTWNVPPSIIQNEYLPALQQDPQALERIGLKIAQEPDGTVRIWQPPGDQNALGRIRFNFPNKFLVYQHDTPDKHLFAKETRAYSHGCMRVENPLKYGEVLLSQVMPKERYTQERLRSMFGGSEININFPTAIPVHLTYQTAFVDEGGKLVVRDDVYGRDARLLAVLKGSDRRVADIAIDRPQHNSAAPVRMPPGTYGGSGGGLFGSGPSFFERLFGSFEPATPPRPRARVGRANDRQSVR